MIPTTDVMRAELPNCFKKYKNLQVIIDATEFFVKSPTHFEEYVLIVQSKMQLEGVDRDHSKLFMCVCVKCV